MRGRRPLNSDPSALSLTAVTPILEFQAPLHSPPTFLFVVAGCLGNTVNDGLLRLHGIFTMHVDGVCSVWIWVAELRFSHAWLGQ